jgi:hypothetical protein
VRVSAPEALLEGSSWTQWRFFSRRSYFELCKGGSLLATLRMVHFRYKRVAFGELLGEAWTLERRDWDQRLVFRRGGWTGDVAAEYSGVDSWRFRDLNGHSYSQADSGDLIDESGRVILVHDPDRWKDGHLPVLGFGDVQKDDHIEWLVLLQQYLYAHERNMPRA